MSNNITDRYRCKLIPPIIWIAIQLWIRWWSGRRRGRWCKSTRRRGTQRSIPVLCRSCLSLEEVPAEPLAESEANLDKACGGSCFLLSICKIKISSTFPVHFHVEPLLCYQVPSLPLESCYGDFTSSIQYNISYLQSMHGKSSSFYCTLPRWTVKNAAIILKHISQ